MACRVQASRLKRYDSITLRTGPHEVQRSEQLRERCDVCAPRFLVQVSTASMNRLVKRAARFSSLLPGISRLYAQRRYRAGTIAFGPDALLPMDTRRESRRKQNPIQVAKIMTLLLDLAGYKDTVPLLAVCKHQRRSLAFRPSHLGEATGHMGRIPVRHNAASAPGI